MYAFPPQGASVVAHSPLPMVGGAPQLVPARVWSEHQMPDSRIYYYNKVTRQSVWEKPKDFELVMPLPLNLAAIVGMESMLKKYFCGGGTLVIYTFYCFSVSIIGHVDWKVSMLLFTILPTNVILCLKWSPEFKSRLDPESYWGVSASETHL